MTLLEKKTINVRYEFTESSINEQLLQEMVAELWKFPQNSFHLNCFYLPQYYNGPFALNKLFLKHITNVLNCMSHFSIVK